MSLDNKIKVGISHGDINGIGLEVIIKTFAEQAMFDVCTPILFSSAKTFAYHKKTITGFDDVAYEIVKDSDRLNLKKINLVSCYEEEVEMELGKPTANGGKYAFKSLDAATVALLNKKIDVLVTAPINKNNIQSNDFKFPGHTEFLEKKFSGNALMILASEQLRVAVVTGHVPVAQVAQHITTDNVYRKIKLLNQSLIKDFGVRKPRIAVLGLNPHAGDNGVIGDEEKTAIIPAIEKARQEGLMVFGPYSADGFFGQGTHSSFDAVLAMYHDQGLIPFKTLAFSTGINYTAGLDVVRTSPDHGTGYDIAGKNQANEQSFRNAIYLACDIFRSRKNLEQISSNPLPITARNSRDRDN
ncbi:MAG: 4-hydroxythreonine-4-phosphate dehydrogenase PdxA [Bacteroidetes bacterium]|nr:4-hydroxythreonine-4-phosphate dehydrogenase PdxA [Bacteroidota bacterium]